ncbi:MAG: hypothetical protein WDZ80_04380 [Candidatus Paceibacterota bacterium]
MSKKIYAHIGLNIARIILALIFNLSWLLIVSVILWIAFSLKVAIIYTIIVVVLRPMFSNFIKPRKKLMKERNERIGHNFTLYATDPKIEVEECISTVSFYLAEQMNYSVELFLRKKDLNYLATIISSFMVIAYYQHVRDILKSDEEALSKLKQINDGVHADIQIHNRAITEQYKSFLKSESEEILENLSKVKDHDKTNLADQTAKIIISFLDEKALVEMNQQIQDHFKSFLTTIYDNFSEALKRRSQISSFL